MIINIPPTTALEIQLVNMFVKLKIQITNYSSQIVEESEERLTEQHVEEILKICAKYLNVTPKNNDDVEEG